jgi:hypothetical protein
MLVLRASCSSLRLLHPNPHHLHSLYRLFTLTQSSRRPCPQQLCNPSHFRRKSYRIACTLTTIFWNHFFCASYVSGSSIVQFHAMNLRRATLACSGDMYLTIKVGGDLERRCSAWSQHHPNASEAITDCTRKRPAFPDRI